MKNLDVTVIVPVFNSAQFVCELIDCLKQQSYESVEFIIINDGSTDNSEQQILDNIRDDSRFKYYSQKNLGVSAARNNGLSRAKGKFVTFMDADDYIDPDYILLLVKAMRNLKTSLAITNIKEEHLDLANNITFAGEEAYNALYSKFRGYVHNKMFIRSVIKQKQLLFDESLSIGEDLKFVFEYAFAFNLNFKISFVAEDAYSYRKRMDSSINKDTFLFYSDLSKVSNYLLEKDNVIELKKLYNMINANFLYFYYKQKALAKGKNNAFIIPKRILKERQKLLSSFKKRKMKIFIWKYFPLIANFISIH